MTVSSTYTPMVYSGNGATTAFPVTWPFFTGTLIVTAISSGGVETTRTITTDYSVTGGTDSNGLPATGTVTMLSAPASGTQIRITRTTPKVQATTWAENDPFPQKTVEAMADRLMLIAQENAGGGEPNDNITGDVLSLNSSGAQDYWDGEDNPLANIPFVEFDEGSAPSTPDSGKLRVYAKTDGELYAKNDVGAEVSLTGPTLTRGGKLSVGDAAYVIPAGARTVMLTAYFTTARAFTLPLASAHGEGEWIDIIDPGGYVTSTNFLGIQRAGSDTINGNAAVYVTSPHTQIRFYSDGVSAWSAGGVPSVEQIQFYPPINPSSGNIQGSGTPKNHQLIWADSNAIFHSDAIYQISNDPSALATIAVGGTSTAGDVVTLTFTVSGTPYAAAYTVQSGDTTTQIAAGIVAAVIANTNLYGAVEPVARVSGGGSDKPISYMVSTANVIDFDHDSRLTISVQKTISGAATETLTISSPNSFGATLSKVWDANPLTFFNRLVPGVAPVGNVWNLVIGGGHSVNPNQVVQQYANGGVRVLSSTVGAISSRWEFFTPDLSGNITQGICIGAGIYGASATGADPGADGANFAVVEVNGRSIMDRDFAMVRRSADQTISSLGSFVKIEFNTEVAASSNFDSTTNYRYTAANAGRFVVTVPLDIAVGAMPATMAFRLYKNGAGYGPQRNLTRAAFVNDPVSLSFTIDLAANDYIEMYVYTTQVITIVGGAAGSYFNVLEMVA